MSHFDLETPGTVHIVHDEALEGVAEITLIPTPSNDPEDPLNWSKGRKSVHLACMSFYTLIASMGASALASIFEPLSIETGLTLDQLNVGIGYAYLFIGLSVLVLQPAALAFGKRPLYICTSAAATGITVWTAFVSGNGQWIANRLLVGFLTGPSFSLVEVSIADTYFLHERSTPMGIYVCLLYLGALLSPILGGYIYSGLGWKWIIWLLAGANGLVTLVLFFFLEETNFKCDVPYVPHEAEVITAPSEHASDKDGKTYPNPMAVPVPSPRPCSAWPGPRFWKFGKTSPHAAGIISRGFIQPLALMPSPLVFWCGVMYGIYQVYFNLFACLSSGVLSAPPYNFAPNSVGLSWISPLVACIPGAVFGGYLADKYAIYKAKRNNGICEPEHKLQLFLLPTVLVPVGLLMMGLGPYYEAHWIVYVLGEGVLNLVGPLATVLVLSYAFDCFHPIQPRDLNGVNASVQDSAPYICCTMVISMLVAFGFGYAITPWAFTWGLKKFAISAALSSLVFNGSVVGIYFYGKRLRRFGYGYYCKVINW